MRSCTWFFKKVFQVGDDGLGGRTRDVSTVDFATSMPSLGVGKDSCKIPADYF